MSTHPGIPHELGEADAIGTQRCAIAGCSGLRHTHRWTVDSHDVTRCPCGARGVGEVGVQPDERFVEDLEVGKVQPPTLTRREQQARRDGLAPHELAEREAAGARLRLIRPATHGRGDNRTDAERGCAR